MTSALGTGPLLPTPEELQRRLARTEIELFLGRGELDEELLATAWYLHAVGSARETLEIYPVERQRRAHRISAHIFDLALSAMPSDSAPLEQLQITFAGQIGYLRGDLTPNATALYRRLSPHRYSMRDDPGSVSLEIGAAFLALDRPQLFPRLDSLREEARRLQNAVQVSDLIETPYGAVARVVEAVRDMLVHFTYNRPERLQHAITLLTEAISAPFAQADIDSRWVAAHLRDMGGDLSRTSVWALLPPNVPVAAARAMTLGDPPILSLWPPQFDLLSSTPSPLEPASKRMLLSFPTSAGKTLLAQYIALAHIAAGEGSVCVVVPTHSLAREVRRDLDRRMDLLARQVRDAGPLGTALPQDADVLVMTPERLLAQLRAEPERLLRDFTLFLIDEAQLLGDPSRGWILESALSFLHARTSETGHRIVLLSAALGNRAHIRSWLSSAAADVTVAHHDWRGPRRVLSLFASAARWEAAALKPPRRKGMLNRRVTPLHGLIAVRTAGHDIQNLSTTEPIGELVQVERASGWERHTSETTPGYRMRAELATFLGRHGPLLVIEATKTLAQSTAAAIAASLEDEDATPSPLAALAVTRLGEGHPLVATLRRGVGFHHSALPDDIQAELEESLRQGTLRYLVATTTLVEGINFPVRSVLIGEREYRTGSGSNDVVTTINAPRLMNAIGRAGRAGRETEGWVVLWLAKSNLEEGDFSVLEGADEDLVATSHLATSQAFAALEEFEDLVRTGADAVFEYEGREVADFVSHVWFVASALSELHLIQSNPAELSLESTLAWHQMDDATRLRWRAVADLAIARYEAQPPESRRRWSRTGTSLPTAVALERLVDEISRGLPIENQSDPKSAFDVIAGEARLETILAFGESSFRGFRPRRNAPRGTLLNVDLRGLAREWLGGVQLRDLCDSHLSDVPDETYRYEQLSEFVSQILEHLLPWVLSTIIQWTNERLPRGTEALCLELPGFMRYGVDSATALALMVGGIRSRRLAHVVADRFGLSDDFDNPRSWLASMDVNTWRNLFDATPTELFDLLVFTRARDAHVTSRVLAGERIEIPIESTGRPSTTGDVDLQEVVGDHPAPIVARRAGEIVATIPPAYHDDIRRLISIGVPVRAELLAGDVLGLQVVDLTQTRGWFGDA